VPLGIGFIWLTFCFTLAKVIVFKQNWAVEKLALRLGPFL
jgi:hypothetical protein